jgi:hypothetical protein
VRVLAQPQVELRPPAPDGDFLVCILALAHPHFSTCQASAVKMPAQEPPHAQMAATEVTESTWGEGPGRILKQEIL